MFGMGMWELIVIAVIALLALGPEKLPEAAKTLSKGIRDFRRQTRELQETLHDDTEIGDAIRDLQSALRGEEPSPHVRQRQQEHEAAQKAAEQTGSGDQPAESGNASGEPDGVASSEAGDGATASDEAGDDPAAPEGLHFGGFPVKPLFQPPADVVSREDSTDADNAAENEVVADSTSGDSPDTGSDKAHG